MEIKLASAFLSIDLLNGEQLQEIALAMLESGLVSDSLVELAVESNTTLRDHKGTFMKCLKEQGVDIMSPHNAGVFIAKHHAKNIIKGIIKPYDGAKAIVTDVVYNVDILPPEVNVFFGHEDEYMEFTDQIRLDYYGAEYCEKVLKNIELEITQAAINLLKINAYNG